MGGWHFDAFVVSPPHVVVGQGLPTRAGRSFGIAGAVVTMPPSGTVSNKEFEK